MKFQVVTKLEYGVEKKPLEMNRSRHGEVLLNGSSTEFI